jgi:hypothetical protein
MRRETTFMRKSFFPAVAVAAAVLVAALQGVHAQENYCAVLRRVMVDAANSFGSIKEKYDGRLFWSVRVDLPGSEKCRVSIDRLIASYDCTNAFDLREDAERHLENLTGIIRKCLPDREVVPSKDVDGFPRVLFYKSRADVDISVSLDKELGTKRFEIEVSVSHDE